MGFFSKSCGDCWDYPCTCSSEDKQRRIIEMADDVKDYFIKQKDFCIRVNSKKLFEEMRDISRENNGFFDDNFRYEQFNKIAQFLCFRKILFNFIEPKYLMEMSCAESKPLDLYEIKE